MVISNLNIKLIEDRLGFVNQAVFKLKKLARLTEKEFLIDDTPAIAESYLRRLLEAIFDIGRHIISKTAGKGIVEYKEIAGALGKNKIITDNCAEKLRLMAGYRNRLVHFYQEVSDKELYSIVKTNLTDVENFVKQIMVFIDKYKSSPHIKI